MVPGDSDTLVKGNFDPDSSDGGTMIQHATLTNDQSEPDSGSMIEVDLPDLGTMVINEDDDGTMQSKIIKKKRKLEK